MSGFPARARAHTAGTGGIGFWTLVASVGALVVGACGEGDGAEVPPPLDSAPGAYRPPVSSAPEVTDTPARPTALPQAYTVDVAIERAGVGGPVGAAIVQRMDAEAARLQSDLQGIEVVRVGEGIKVTLDVGVPFEEGSDDLAPETMDYLSRLARRLIEQPDVDVIIVGHSDGTGPAEANLRLSERRAMAAVGYLTLEGVDPSRLSAVGRGQSEPVEIGDVGNPSVNRKNRRVEVGIFASGRMKEGIEAGRAGP